MATLVNIYWLGAAALANSGVTLSLRCHHPPRSGVTSAFAQLSPSGVIFMDVTIADHPQTHSGMATCCLPTQLAASFFTQDCPSSKRFLLPGIFYYLVLTIQAPGFPCLYRGLADSSRFGIKILSGKRWAFFQLYRFSGFQVFLTDITCTYRYPFPNF